jgi:hypothetical protein
MDTQDTSAVAPETTVNTTPETVVEQKPKTPEHIDKFASKFAALTRKERESTEKWKARDAEYTQKLTEIEERQKKLADLENLDKEISSDKRKALEFLNKKGVTLEDLQNLLIDELNPNEEVKFKRMQSDTEAKLMKQIEELKNSLTEKDTRVKTEAEEEAKKQHEKVVQRVMTDLTEFVNKDESYELIRSYNSVDTVYELMNQHYMEQVNKGIPDQMIKILSYKEACDAVEAHLDEEVKKVYEAKRAKQAPKKEEAKEPKTTQTLSNTMSTEVPKSGERNLSNEESIKEAAKLLRYHDN